jgi:hypothetical protein
VHSTISSFSVALFGLTTHTFVYFGAFLTIFVLVTDYHFLEDAARKSDSAQRERSQIDSKCSVKKLSRKNVNIFHFPQRDFQFIPNFSSSTN